MVRPSGGPAADTARLRQAPPTRVLFVHAHPDDETITTGGTIALCVDAGLDVTVLTLTRGERGEVIPPEFAHLEGTPALADHREGELATALTELGVTDARFLGDEGARRIGLPLRRYTDSGMVWGQTFRAEAAPDAPADSLAMAPLAEVVDDVVAVIEQTGAEIVVSYDADGGYGHPDHVRAHDAAIAAADRTGARFVAVLGEGDTEGDRVYDVAEVLDRKRRALAAHRTQVAIVDETRFRFSNGAEHEIASLERFRFAPRQGAEPRVRASWPTLIGAHVLALLAGAFVGVVGTLGHSSMWPWGLVLGLVATAGLLVGLRLATDSRTLPGVAAVGVLGAAALFTLEGAGGSVAVQADTAGYVWTYGAPVVALLAVAWPRLGRARRPVAR